MILYLTVQDLLMITRATRYTSKEILEIVIVLGWKVPVKPVFPTENNHPFLVFHDIEVS